MAEFHWARLELSKSAPKQDLGLWSAKNTCNDFSSVYHSEMDKFNNFSPSVGWSLCLQYLPTRLSCWAEEKAASSLESYK